MSDADCRACAGRWPERDFWIADLGASQAYLHDDQFFPGWTVVVLKRHASELFQLERGERAQLMEEVSATAAAVASVFGAVKMNYALLGNQLPHIHWHLIPRLAADPAPKEPVWTVPLVARRPDDGERTAAIARIRGALGR
ncbi:MAG: HIT family protein [Candidatus Rokubacteria bacterium]|nr:HIT family protein [Candidatus Rokubacteria bacterium]